MASRTQLPTLLGSRLARVVGGGLVLALGLALFLGACPGTGDTCECFLCSNAIELTVVEADTSTAIDDFFVEVIHEGEPQGEPEGCLEGFRNGNQCSFGAEPGVYQIIVSAPGYQTVEAVTRVASEENSSLCCSACLSAKPLRLSLTPSSSD